MATAGSMLDSLPDRDRVNGPVASIIFVLFSLSDIYYPGFGRAFDYLAILALAYLFSSGRIPLGSVTSAIALIILLAPWLLLGLLSRSTLAVAAIVLGAIAVYPIFRADALMSRGAMYRVLAWIIAANLGFLVVQLTYYIFTRGLLDFGGALGAIESRSHNVALEYFRPGGLFQEPNMYCAALYSLLVVRYAIARRFTTLDYVTMLSMVCTQSLWGAGGVVLLLWARHGTLRNAVLMGAGVALAILVFFAVGPDLNALSARSVTLHRILNLGSDPSALARFGSGKAMDLMVMLWGAGVNTVDFQEYAANGMAFLVYSFGFAGLSMVGLWLWFGERLRSPRLILLVVFLFSTFPLVTYMYFWVWLALLVRFGADEAPPQQANSSPLSSADNGELASGGTSTT